MADIDAVLVVEDIEAGLVHIVADLRTEVDLVHTEADLRIEVDLDRIEADLAHTEAGFVHKEAGFVHMEADHLERRNLADHRMAVDLGSAALTSHL